MPAPLIELKSIRKTFVTRDGTTRPVLEGVDFALHEREIVAILGQSGSGKSTMLRIMAGLVPPDGGEVLFRGRPLFGPARGVSMVFQSFALFPWLTVQKNVELGLEATGVPARERAERARDAIALIGLSGFEGALPRELSGGMRQRVGIARALVMQPEVLLMDEAFSALDVLTGERLRDDILELWESRRISTQAILVVSHNIEEAVIMADRVLLFASDPGRIHRELAVELPRPRRSESLLVRGLVDQVYDLMTSGHARPGRPNEKEFTLHLGDRLPNADVKRMEGILELLDAGQHGGSADLPFIAEESELSDDELLQNARALTILGFTQLRAGDIELTPLGRHYALAGQPERQAIFGRQIMEHVPLIAYIRQSLEQDRSGDLPEDLFLRLLRFTLSESAARDVLKTAIEWGRYGDLFEYDLHAGVIHRPIDETTGIGADAV